MPWTCPKCGLHVGHGEPPNLVPNERTLYRCPVCRLELMFDPSAHKMRPASRPPDEDPPEPNA
jgi:hypothetical protein